MTRTTKLTTRRVQRYALHQPTQIRQHVLTISHPRRAQHRHRTRPLVPLGPHIPLLLVVRRRRLAPCRLVRHHTRPADRQRDQCGVGHLLHQRLEHRGRHRLWRVSSRGKLGAHVCAVVTCAGEMVVSGGSIGRAASRRAMDSWAWEMRRTPAAWAARSCGSSGTATAMGAGACGTWGAVRLRRTAAEDMLSCPQPSFCEFSAPPAAEKRDRIAVAPRLGPRHCLIHSVITGQSVGTPH